MRFEKSLELPLVHCQSELGHVLVHGAPEIPGATMLDKMKHINRVDVSLRRFVTFDRSVRQPVRPDTARGSGRSRSGSLSPWIRAGASP